MDAGASNRERASAAHHSAANRTVLALTLLFVLAALFVSTGLVAYAAWRGDLANGIFAILFAVLSAKAALVWLAWSSQPFSARPVNSSTDPQDLVSRKPAT